MKDVDVVVEGLHINWLVDLRFATPEWWKRAEIVDIVMGVIGETDRWGAFTVWGLDHGRGKPLPSAAAMATIIRGGKGGLYSFAAGGPQAAMFGDETDAWLQIGIAQTRMTLMTHLRGDILARFGVRAIDDMVEALVALRGSLDGEVDLLEASAFPTASGALDYERPLPRRRAVLPIDAIADLFDLRPAAGPAPAPDSREAEIGAAASTLARAALPKGVFEEQQEGLRILRWTNDPASPVAVCRAAARHDAWLRSHIATEPLYGES